MLIRRTAAGAMVGVLAVLVAGCRGSAPAADDALGTTPPPTTISTPTVVPTTPKPTPTADISTLPAAKILAKAQAAANAAKSVRMKGTMADGRDRMTLDLRLAKGGGQGTIMMDGTAITVMVIGKTAYLKLSDEFWRSQTKSKAEADAMVGLIAGRWIRTTLDKKEFRDFAMFGDKAAAFEGILDAMGKVRKTAPRTIDGVPAIGLRDSEGTLWVDRATGRPLRVETSGTDVVTFSEYDRVTTPKAPPADQVIDGEALGI
ncbi:hypothetical protein ACFV9C_44075 [Kribbella sp. NPDC059898]|uniref:hypothetical protein n=1 Tax=Kribbella sp. NPDC059898 TaxID=3346995 RepID=UPI0036525AE3